MIELFEADEVRKALGVMLEPGAVFEVRAVEAQLLGYGNRRPGTVSGYFDSIDACLSELKKLAGAKGIYITLNPVNPACLARRANRLAYADKDSTTKDHHILRRRYLPIDVDYDRPSGISTTNAEKEITRKKAREIYAYLKGRGWPPPVVADSGNAYHLDYRIELPCEDDGLVEKALDALANRFDGDRVLLDRGVHNESRIIKLYGTLVCKGDNMPERPWRLSKILDAPVTLEVVTTEQVRALVDELLPKEPAKGKASESRSAERNSKPSKEQVREMLAVIPKRPHYADWITVVAAVGDALSISDAVEVLNEWSAEEEPGEYAQKLQSGFEKIHVGTLFHIAKQHGWKPTHRAQVEREPVELPPPSPPYVPPPLDLLPPVVQQYVRAAAEALDVDISFILLPMLSSLGAAIGNSRSIILKRGFIQPPVIWTGIIGRSGSRKSPALEAGCFGVMKRERELMQQNRQAEELYAEELAEWEGKGKGRGQKPVKPTFLTGVLDDLTIEVLADALVENPRGILVRKDELSHWLASFDQYRKGVKGSDVARWLTLHSAFFFGMDRRTDQRHYRIHNPRACLTGGIQPKVLQRILTEDFFERGLPARFLFAYPPGHRGEWSEATVHDDLQGAILDLFDKLWLLPPDHDEHRQARPKLLPLDADAKAVFVAFYNECGAASVDAGEHEEAAWCKLAGHAARLGLVGQLARDPNAKIVTGNTMRAACELARWFGNEAVRIYAELAETAEQREQRQLVEFIQRRGGTVTERELYTNYSPFKNKPAETKAALERLVSAGRGEWKETRGARGPETREFHLLHPSASAGFPISPSIAPKPADADSGIVQEDEAPLGPGATSPQSTPEKLRL